MILYAFRFIACGFLGIAFASWALGSSASTVGILLGAAAVFELIDIATQLSRPWES